MPPVAKDCRTVQELEKGRLVIATQEYLLDAFRRRAAQYFDHAARVWPPVDIVAQIDDGRPPVGGGSDAMLRDLGLQANQKVGPAVDVADGIYRFAFSRLRDAPVLSEA